MEAMTLEANAVVRVTGETAGAVIGRIDDMRTVDEMPELGELGFATAGEFAPKNIMREMGVARVATISYVLTPGEALVFSAFEVAGRWYDLRGQRLALEIVGNHAV